MNKIILIGLLGLAVLLSGCTKEEQEFEEIITTEGNKTYRQYLDNYYEVDYEVTPKKISIEINNPCLDISTSCGTSMKPVMNDECELTITDTCYDFNKLEIGDVVVFNKPYDYGKIQHRIIDIDYKKGWIKTKGDNNDGEDDFTGKDLIYGKTIGFLEVLDDQKVIKEEVIESDFILNGSIEIVGIGNSSNLFFGYMFEFDNKTIGCKNIIVDDNGYLKCLDMEVIE